MQVIKAANCQLDLFGRPGGLSIASPQPHTGKLASHSLHSPAALRAFHSYPWRTATSVICTFGHTFILGSKTKSSLRVCFLLLLLGFYSQKIKAQTYQWMVEVDSIISGETNDHPHAFLWIPENCKQVRGVVVGQHNMLEEDIMEHPSFRKTLAELSFAEVWITPALDVNFDFNKHTGEHFNEMMQSLATVSGYSELAFAPIVPIGHSALASYPWNFAAWNPERTLAVLSIHGDAPLTNLTGSGKPNPDWGNRSIDGVPGLMVEGEYEWWIDRVKPAMAYRQKHPQAPVSFLADAGHGHFDFSDKLVDYLDLFLNKTAFYRLPNAIPIDKPANLKPIDPTKGWLADRWRPDSLPLVKAAPYNDYNGNRDEAFWYFDKEIAEATENYYATVRGKKPQHFALKQNGITTKPAKTFANYNLQFLPYDDGITFNITPFFSDTSKTIPVNEHASSKLNVDRICGPVKKVNDTTFQLSFYRMGFNNPKRSNDIWLMITNKGDDIYKSAVQQIDMKFPLISKEGQDQHIDFPAIGDQKNGIKSLQLNAFSSVGLPVHYYVQQGPAEIEGNQIKFTTIPPRTKFPIKITVVAWQYGRANGSKIKTAEPVFNSFYLIK